jgi:hypothetical protein
LVEAIPWVSAGSS